MMSRCWVLLLAITIFLAGCVVQSPFPTYSHAWAYADLRQLDPVDAPSPNNDLLAGYTRQRPGELQIRLDLLEMNPQPDFDLYLALDLLPGGTTDLPLQVKTSVQWDSLLVIPASGAIQRLFPQNGASQLQSKFPASLRVLRDPTLDTLSISLKFSAQKGGVQPIAIEVFLTQAGQIEPVDALGPFRSDSLPPQPAQVLFAFWNTYPAYTPAQALRRWDGAHTGPQGGRHGLYNLLRVARAAKVPITLLDLNQPAALSALDYLGGLELVKQMVDSGLLTLPQSLPGFPPQVDPSWIEIPAAWVLDKAWKDGRQVDQDFGLPGSPFIFSPAGLAPYQINPDQSMESAVRAIFLPVSALGATSQRQFHGATNLFRWQDKIIIPISDYGIPEEQAPEASDEGLSLEVRRKLIETALASQSKYGADAPILVLGGDLPSSTWGIPELARTAFHYLGTHPWMRVLDAQDLLCARPVTPVSPNLQVTESNRNVSEDAELNALLDELRHAPHNPLGLAAWQAYLAAYAPAYPSPADLPLLRAHYLGQASVLLEAARWAENPLPVVTCKADPDRDGVPECILASDEIFTIFELDSGGYLASAFSLSPDGEPHQFIGPSSQLISGMTESSTWDLSQGARADPGVIPGAFIDLTLSDQVRANTTVNPEESQLTLSAAQPTSGGAVLRKIFQLAPGEIQVMYTGLPASAPYTIRIPVLLDPWQRFLPGWSVDYQTGSVNNRLTWRIISGLTVEIQSTATLLPSTFSDSQRFMDKPEDPNRDYPPGHFLPFPLSVVDMTATGEFTATLRLTYP